MLKKLAKSYLRTLEVIAVLFILHKVVREAFSLMNASNDILNFTGLVILTFVFLSGYYYIKWFIQRINKKQKS